MTSDNRIIMTPGPTMANQEVLEAFAQNTTNPDLDPLFFEFYKATCEQLQRLMNTQNEVLILSGEGILGLEAACASIIEPGDKVLVIDNGIYGNGFGDFAKMYGAEVTYFKSSYEHRIDAEALEVFLESHKGFKAATLVHCETPSGITNDLSKIGPLLSKHGMISIVDSVSGIGGETLETDLWELDLVLGGSQKCLSCPPGLTFLSISSKAWTAMEARKIPVAGYYCNLVAWKSWYKDKWFPYTQPANHIQSLRKAVDQLLEDKDALERHKKLAHLTRTRLQDMGVALYAKNGHANTVTTALLPVGITFTDLFTTMLEDHNIMIAGGFGHLKDRIFRIGHMGENCREEYVVKTLDAVSASISKLSK